MRATERSDTAPTVSEWAGWRRQLGRLWAPLLAGFVAAGWLVSVDRRGEAWLVAIGTLLLTQFRSVMLGTTRVDGRVRRLRLGRATESADQGASGIGPPGVSDSEVDLPRDEAAPARPDGEVPRPPRGRRVVQVLGVLAVLMLVDLAAGTLLTATGWMLPEDRGDVAEAVEGSIARTMAAAPIGAEPWAPQYAADMARFELGTGFDGVHYVPFLFRSFHPFDSEFINVTAEERLSHQPYLPSGVEPSRVAFFGGSVMFGVGQRDEHTIPSEFARMAEAAGIPVEVHNYGLPTWVSWQEQAYLERLLARGHEFDMVVFLDGFNEFEAQRSDYSTEPTHIAARWMDSLLGEFRGRRQSPPGATDGLRELAQTYRRNSAVWRITDSLTGRREVLSGGDITTTASSADQSEAALATYRRSLDRIEDLGDDRMPIRFFWQPRRQGWDQSVLAALPAQTRSLAAVFEGRESELYIDDVHTNEVGAHLIAEAMWVQLGPELSDRSPGPG